MHILLSGSLAYDYIMDFPDTFDQHILPDHIHSLNVCFVVEQLKKNYGGTAGNIAYTMALLEGKPLILAPIGSDSAEYMHHFSKNHVATTYIRTSSTTLTASAHITTDKQDNQITAFFSGACQEATELHVSDVKEPISFVMISPTQKEAMIQHAKECHEAHIPFCFDPGQQITAFSDQEMMQVIGQANFYIVNDYEMKLTTDKTGWDKEELLNHVDVLIITLGEKGSVIATKEQTFEIPPCAPTSVDDPTGAGDAYRAGFFTAYVQGHDYQTCGQVGSVAAAYAIELDTFVARYKETYGETIDLVM